MTAAFPKTSIFTTSTVLYPDPTTNVSPHQSRITQLCVGWVRILFTDDFPDPSENSKNASTNGSASLVTTKHQALRDMNPHITGHHNQSSLAAATCAAGIVRSCASIAT
jgi:hypothetical protein